MAFTFKHLAEVAWGNALGQAVGDGSMWNNRGTERRPGTAWFVTGGSGVGKHAWHKCF